MIERFVVGSSTIVEKHYVVPHHPGDRRGFSEEYIRDRLEKKGWDVWRGGFLHASRKDDVYPNVKQRYEMLSEILPDRLSLLQYVGVVHHGMPDLFCYKAGRRKFVECKLGYESLSDRQCQTIQLLQGVGFDVEVHRINEHATRTLERRRDLESGERRAVREQTKITMFK